MSVEKLNLDINEVRREFESWRAVRKVREAIPQNLLDTAVKLLEHYPVKIVCRELRLNPTRLKQQREGGALVEPKRTKQFLALSAQTLSESLPQNPQLLSGNALPSSECKLMLEKKDGSRLTISLPLDWPRIEKLCANLLKA